VSCDGAVVAAAHFPCSDAQQFSTPVTEPSNNASTVLCWTQGAFSISYSYSQWTSMDGGSASRYLSEEENQQRTNI
jgi:hypothetical protein